MFAKYCRVCGISDENSATLFFPLFTKDMNDKVFTVYGTMFVECLFEIDSDINYPQFICDQCQSKLCEFNDFRQMAVETYTKIAELTSHTVDQEEEAEKKDVDNTISVQHLSPNSDENIKDIQFIDFPSVELADIKIEDNDLQNVTHQCKYCQKLYSKDQNLKRHIQREHLTCKICSQKFMQNGNLKAHVAKHYMPSPAPKTQANFMCKICGKDFKKRKILAVHEFRHTENRSIQCDLCDKRFKVKCDLFIHMRVHNDIRKYVCNICGFAFRSKTHLDNHIESHSTGPPQYECSICSQRIKTKKSLRLHISRMHSNAGKFTCRLCYAKYGCITHLKRHLTMVHVKSGEIQEEEIGKYARSGL